MAPPAKPTCASGMPAAVATICLALLICHLSQQQRVAAAAQEEERHTAVSVSRKLAQASKWPPRSPRWYPPRVPYPPRPPPPTPLAPPPLPLPPPTQRASPPLQRAPPPQRSFVVSPPPAKPPPPLPPPVASPTSGFLCPDQDAILAQTNVYRAQHQAPPLVWDADLAVGSAAYGAKLAKTCTLTHSGGSNYGESLMMVQQMPAPDRTCMIAIKRWYSEVMNYDFDTINAYSDNWPKIVGHFTQLVWKSTTKVGCGYGFADLPLVIAGRTYMGGCKIIVCRYQPGGNVAWDPYFTRNVLPNITTIKI